MKPVIELHIDEVVLHGFPSLDHRQRSRIREVLQQQLTGLLTDSGLPPSYMQGGTIHKMDGGTFKSESSNVTGDIGANIARHVYRGLSGSRFSSGKNSPSTGKGGYRP